MPCTFKPMQAYGCSRSSLLQRLGIGDVWSFLRDLVQNVMLRADFYDGEGNFYHGFANTIGTDGVVETYDGTDDIQGYTSGVFGGNETVNDYWQENPQSEEMILAPGVTSFIRSMPRYAVTAVGSAWSDVGTHKEMVYKVSINGDTWYGRMPLFSQNVNSATYLPSPAAGLGTTVTTFGQATTALKGLHNSLVDLNNRLADQGIIRAIRDGEGPH
jgi:hypothetical protein